MRTQMMYRVTYQIRSLIGPAPHGDLVVEDHVVVTAASEFHAGEVAEQWVWENDYRMDDRIQPQFRLVGVTEEEGEDDSFT